MKTKKFLVGITGIALVAALTVGIALAYLTDSEQKVNTFTVGDLDITLSEPEWDDTEDGKEMEPGYETEKDPTVKAVDGNSYMRVTLEFAATDGAEMSAARVAKIMETLQYGGAAGVNTKAFTKDETRSTVTKYVYNFGGVFEEGAEVTLFDTVKIPTAWNQTDLAVLGSYKLIIRAEAIQASGFANAEEAYKALDAEILAGTAQEDYKTVNGGV